MLQNRRPAGTTYPLCFLLSALSELLIVLMNILEESRNGGVRGVGGWGGGGGSGAIVSRALMANDPVCGSRRVGMKDR